jgi:ribosome-associated protein
LLNERKKTANKSRKRMIRITGQLFIPEEELRFSASRSSGPGGQNVNKVNTRVTLRFDVVNSPTLSRAKKRRVLGRLATRINKDGVLRVVAQRYRSQAANRIAAVERFTELMQGALKRLPPRMKSHVPLADERRRVDEKRRRGRLKQLRSRRVFSED